jgi:DNA-binding transcriptional LysR family regulator
VAAARRADHERTSVLHFAHGSEMGPYASLVADLVAAFRMEHPAISVRVSNWRQTELLDAVRSHTVDVAATFLMAWPDREFDAYRLLQSSLSGVLLGSTHPLAARQSIQLRELRDSTFLSRSSKHWPENYRVVLSALRERGLVPLEEAHQAAAAASGSVQLAAGTAWSLANETIAAPLHATRSVVYRQFTDAPIPAWLALIWRPNAPERVQRLLDVARSRYPEETLAERSLGRQQSDDGERRAEAVIDIHHDDTSRAAVQHREERGEAAEAGAVPYARGNGDDRARHQTADH